MATTFVGVWRAGNDAHYLWQGVDWTDFRAKWDELSADGLRLTDVTTYAAGYPPKITDRATGARVRYSVAWKSGRSQYP